MALAKANMFSTNNTTTKEDFSWTEHHVNIFKKTVTVVIRKSVELCSKNILSCFIAYKNCKAGKGSNIYNREAKITIVTDL